MTMVSTAQYLDRIGFGGDRRSRDLAFLGALQIAHLVAVPFENIDVFRRTGVTTDLEWSLPKVVERRRGGWCFELNGAFGWLLRELGYAVDYVSCQVFGTDGWGPPLDHCALVVHLDGERWFVDVGFGDCCMVPVRMVEGEQAAVPRDVRLTIDSDRFRMEERSLDGIWRDSLQGRFEPRALADFTPRSDYLQTEPGLAWTEKPFATRATAGDGSRVTLRNGVLRVRERRGEFVDTPVTDDQFEAMLFEHFEL
jgi:N-hydroxyarylamine O-acetyltransferase